MRSRWILLAAAVILLGAFRASAQTASAPATTSDAQTGLLKSSEAFLRNLFAWGPDFQVQLGPLSPSPSPEFYLVPIHVTYHGQSDTGVIYVSKDGKTLLRGELYNNSADPFAEIRARLHLENNPSKGPADARITVVEFSDFECPHCRELYRALKEIEPQYPQVRVVYKDFPIAAVHPWAMTAAIGARCAYMQSPAAFWKLHDAVFDNQDLISAENVWKKLLEFAAAAGLDADAFKACMASPEARKAVEANFAEGEALNINSTPTVFVNGRSLVGGEKTTLEQYINYELALQHASGSPPAAPAASPTRVPPKP